MIKDILGADTWQAFATQYFFAIVGVIISLLIHSNKRDVNAPTTPYKFKLTFLLLDNWKRIVLNLLLIYITIRFFKEITGVELSLFFCLLVGIGFDKLAEWIKTKASLLDVDRSKINKP